MPAFTDESTLLLERPARATRSPAWRVWLCRLGLIVLGLAAWFLTQNLIASRGTTILISDAVLDLLTPIHAYLAQNAVARNAILISSSAGIDALGLFLFGWAIFGKSIRPFVGLLMLFALRQLMQGLCALPCPEGMLWERPPFPSLLVTYGVSNDLFFSGHTAMAVYGAIELARFRRYLWPLAALVAVFEIFTVLSLRAHWTMDVYAGLMTAILIAIISSRISPRIDRLITRLTRAV